MKPQDVLRIADMAGAENLSFTKANLIEIAELLQAYQQGDIREVIVPTHDSPRALLVS